MAFLYGTTRGLKEVREILGCFAGTWLSDGYQIYEKWVSEAPNVIHAQCWAHTRRNFIESEGADPPRSKKGIEYIRVLYEQESQHKELSPEERLEHRREILVPIVQKFFSWLSKELTDLTTLPTSPFLKAASYEFQKKRELSVFLYDPAVPLDTNHLERALRVVPMGRMNWLFCWTESGAHVVGRKSVACRHLSVTRNRPLHLPRRCLAASQFSLRSRCRPADPTDLEGRVCSEAAHFRSVEAIAPLSGSFLYCHIFAEIN